MSSICTYPDSSVYSLPETISFPFSVGEARTAATAVGSKLRNVALRSYVVLGLCMFVVTAVAVYDVYWSFKTRSILHETEQNPLGSMLINMDGGDIALFMTCKMLGTMIAILAIPALYQFRKWWGLSAGVSLAVFQSLVFLYLNFGHLVVSV